MQLILTHENADFDAVAAQLAAWKLFPKAVALLPRRVNRNVQQFLTLYWSRLPFVRPQDWRKQRIWQLLLVDTQTPVSVRGTVRDPEVHVIDHHTGHTRKPAWHYQVEEVGATTTLLVEKLRPRGLSLTIEEATLLLLGIYEDTGSLTYDTTTPRDVQAAAWLLEQGARLHVVRRFLNVPLTPEQLALYEQLQQQAEWLQCAGHDLVVATAVASADFSEEISSVVHRLRDALLPVGLLVLVQIGRDVQLVARSTIDQVDVSQIARALGGGGHNRAAAALVTKRDVQDLKRELITLLQQVVRPSDTVAQIMSHGVQLVTADMPVREAATIMQRFGYEGYPVVDGSSQRLVGLLTRRAVDRAMSHDLARFPVRRIMKAGAVTVSPTDSVEKVQQLMLEEGWGQIPVVSAGHTEVPEADGDPAAPEPIMGIVTRTDVLNHLFQPATAPVDVDMLQRLQAGLSSPLWAMVLAVSAVADGLEMPVYFVGGQVRDLLLGKQSHDLDMVVEGDAIFLAQRLQKRFGGQLHTHRRFGTAKWFTAAAVWQQVWHADMDFTANRTGADTMLPDLNTPLPGTVDFVTARTEFYREPSALPEVERGSIKLDLHRRDFTINTLAVRLDGAHLGELLDFYGGQRDLEKGIIRVLHSISFVDDPTRMLRAVRLEQRLGFVIEARTAELLVDALPMLDRVTGDRIRHELELALRENDPAATMARLDELGILSQIQPQLRWQPSTAGTFARVPEILADPRWQAALGDESTAFVYFALWLAPLPPALQLASMQRLRVRKATREDVAAISTLADRLKTLAHTATASAVEKALRPFRPRVLLIGRLLAAAEQAAQIDRYYHEWRHVRTAVNGDDLRAMDLKPGPAFARWLDSLLAARLDGHVQTRSQELELLQRIIEKEPDRND